MVITSIHHCSYNNTQETTVQFDEYPIQTTVTKDPNHVTAWISQTENVNRLHLHHLVVGLDVEWRPCYLRGSQNPVAVLQLCVNRRCLVYQIIHSPYIPNSLVNFLSNPSYTFTGIGIDDDVEKLYRHYGVGRAASVADLRALAAEVYEDVNESGLKGLTRLVLGKEVEKPRRIRLSNWDDEWLSQEQVEYACVDAFLSFRIGLVLISMAGRASSASSSGVTAFFFGDSEKINVMDADENCFVSSSGGEDKGKSLTSGKSTQGFKNMPMNVKSAEDQLSMLASFIASYENYIQGKINDPALWDEDYDQVDPDDLEEIMDLKWQLAMLSRRVKRFMNRTGRKIIVGGKIGFDKSKVKCYNCQGFGHFARECQRPKVDQRSNSGRQND